MFEAELQDVIPICHASIAGTRIIGRLTVGYVFFFIKLCFGKRKGRKKERKKERKKLTYL